MKKFSKIIVVVESIDIEDSSGSKANVALIKNLHKAGFDLKVYHYTRKDILLEDIPCFAIKEKRNTLMFFLSRGERLLRHKLNLDLHKPLEKMFGFSFTLFNDRDSIVAGLRKVTDFKPDLVLTLSKGGSFRPHHALLQMPEWHNRWMAYIHDPYPMHLYPRPYAWVEPGYFQKWRFVKEMSLNAAFVAFPSYLLLEWMGSYFKDFLSKGLVIPHQIQEGSLNGVELSEYLNHNNFNLVHAGNLLHARDPKGLIEGFKLFLQRNPKAANQSRLLFIGATQYFAEYLCRQEQQHDSIKVIAENRPMEEVNKVQREASVNIILEAKSEISPFLPGKFPNCVAADKPILLLGPYYSETRRLFGEDYKYWAEIDEVENIAGIIEGLYQIWRDKSQSFKLDRQDLEYYLSEKFLKKTLDRILKLA